jgi:CheY-like chemotaxis protein
MGVKRALIVDDSKSARLFLARVLEKYDIDVDSADSAEAAIDYLTSNCPDVIFMDHLMPGMDGLQAVQHIKNDPRTATIPIMMYTSQEGELYLGQARALGAVGVLPKQIKPTDVSKVLYQLHLVPDRRNGEQSSFMPVNVRLAGEAPEAAAGTLSKPLTDSTLREHFAELRRTLVASLDTQTDRITSEVRALLLESLPQPAAPPQPPGPERGLSEYLPPPRAGFPWPWIVAATALTIALLSTALWWRSVRLLENLSEQAAQLRAPGPATLVAAGAPAAMAPAAAAPLAGAAVPEARPIVVLVPYGADALGGARLDVIGKLLYQLVSQKSGALVDIRTFAGRFCLMGNATDGYSQAPEEMPFARCDVVGNPFDETLSPTQRTPLALANLIGDVRRSTNGAVTVRVAVADPANLVQPYPQVAPDLTAGEWNRAAVANNRIEIRVR